MNHLVYELERLIGNYSQQPNVEIEIRLGWQTPERFDTNIGKVYYDFVHQALTSSAMPRRGNNTHVYTHKNTRIITDSQGKIKDAHKKIKLEVVDFLLHGTPFDVRLSVCVEVPVKHRLNLAECRYLRSRSRTTWQHDDWMYDLTCITLSEPSGPFVDSLCSFEFELELMPNRSENSSFLAQSGVMKLCDLLQINPYDQSVISKIKLNHREKNHLKKRDTIRHNKNNSNRQHGIQQQQQRYSLQEL